MNDTPSPSGAPIRATPLSRQSSPPVLPADPVGGAVELRSSVAASASPAGARAQPWGRRASSDAPSPSSSAFIRRDSVVWVRPRLRAAPRSWPARATAGNSRPSSQFIAPS